MKLRIKLEQRNFYFVILEMLGLLVSCKTSIFCELFKCPFSLGLCIPLGWGWVRLGAYL